MDNIGQKLKSIGHDQNYCLSFSSRIHEKVVFLSYDAFRCCKECVAVTVLTFLYLGV